MSHRNLKNQLKGYRGQYINNFVQCKCAPDLLLANLFPNVKEITESWAMFEATNHLPVGYEWNNPDVTVVVVGDGHKPRTAAMFAHRTTWNAISIDPALVPHKYDFKRFTMYRDKVENIEIERSGPLLIVMPHSHARISDCLKNIYSPMRSIITMDCCVPNPIEGVLPDHEYEDVNVWSPHNTIKVWNKI